MTVLPLIRPASKHARGEGIRTARARARTTVDLYLEVELARAVEERLFADRLSELVLEPGQADRIREVL